VPKYNFGTNNFSDFEFKHRFIELQGKIQKRNWVLQECLDRVPDTIDACRELLQFGLKGTDLTVAVMISQGNWIDLYERLDLQCNIRIPIHRVLLSITPVPGKDKGRFIYLTTDDLDISEEEYLSLVDPTNKEVIRLLHYRKQFLQFMNVLNTYEVRICSSLARHDVR